MAAQPRSLKYEYDCYVEAEIENYKDSIPRSTILRIGDEAVCNIRESEQGGFGELLLCTEVDRIIRKRLRLPSYATWRRRRLKLIEAYRRPEHWGMSADAPLVRAVPAVAEAHVLVLGTQEEGTTLYLAANGCQVTTVEDDPDMVDRVILTASQCGLLGRVHGKVSSLDNWVPDVPLHAVVSSPAAFDRLSLDERHRVIEILKSATLDGGVHLVRALAAGDAVLDLDELRQRYQGWDVAIAEQGTSFLARKNIAA
ncbi:MAG: hypothetical protein IT361_00400 [Gemmatimonadaceae bacterium]|nr:hypothetical protein [Gemmatimonadaceae bacterium]